MLTCDATNRLRSFAKLIFSVSQVSRVGSIYKPFPLILVHCIFFFFHFSLISLHRTLEKSLHYLTRHSVEIISPTEENTSPGSTTAPTNGNGNGLVPQGPSSLEETVAGGEATTPPESMGSPRLRSSTQSSTPPMSSSTPQVNATTL